MAVGHLNYGSLDGIKAAIKDYDSLVANGDLTAAQVEIARRDANAKIDDEWLAKIIPLASLPLTDPPGTLHSVSNGFATYFILRAHYRKVEPNKSDWVDDFWSHAEANLNRLLENPQVFVDENGASLVNTAGVASATRDPIFGMEQTENGVRVTSDYQESMEGW